jgi:hypothetical protein
MKAADIYAKCLLPLKEGYPLYCPELPDRDNAGAYYEAYRRKGISIGDVGIITPDGDFDFLFNICDSAAREVNPSSLTNEVTSFDSSVASVSAFGNSAQQAPMVILIL